MGKRKSSSKPVAKKKREALPANFACLFCNHEQSVAVKMDKKAGVGMLSCKVCGQSYQSGINYLSAAVDVYSDWVDACEAVADRSNNVDHATSKHKARPQMSQVEEEHDEDDGFIVDDEVDGEAGYNDE